MRADHGLAAAGARSVRGVGQANGRSVPGALAAVLLLQLRYLHRAQHSQRAARAARWLSRGVLAISQRARNAPGDVYMVLCCMQ